MVTVKELRALAKSYELLGRSKLKKKSDLLRANDEARGAEQVKRLRRVQKTGRYSSLRGDVEKPNKKGRREREWKQLAAEAHAALLANTYQKRVEKNPRLRVDALTRTSKRSRRPHKRGNLPETLAKQII